MSQATASERGKSSSFTTDVDLTNLVVIAGLTAVLFAGALAIGEGLGEIPPDIDWKAFFVVYTVIVFVPWGTPTIAAAVGATIAEGILDFFEGIEPDEPFGWTGYIVGFTVAGYFMKDPSNKVKLAIGAVLGAFIQFAIEGLSLIIISGDATSVYLTALAGNTVTHGIILGAIPLIPIVGALRGRMERVLAPAAQQAD
ncbi:hypothetical protein M0R89_21710 (plasmid) [Halorussus limi]|uniref:Uncharacterized protein n=3 Tax=Halobacteriales TaxID=2235 RepID=A0A8U0I1H4_9EURY|nr:hypothetical protein [Halorussus limi]UPV77038.1 hypothetical protein M0R89_21710 [Halorussus limi]